MIKFDWDKKEGIIGIDGVSRDRTSIEEWYIDEIEDEILIRLDNKLAELKTYKSTPLRFKYTIKLLEEIKSDLHKILIARPKELERMKNSLSVTYYKIFTDKIFSSRKHKSKSNKKRKSNNLTAKPEYFKNIILQIFNYDHYRKNILIELGAKLNIKSCPYCNQHFTLNIIYSKEPGSGKWNHLAKYQFDHFYDKSTYPFLSMSLYNLIPCCGVCNHSKGTEEFDLILHPYYIEKTSEIKFLLNQPIPQLLLDTPAEDRITIDINIPDQEKQKAVEKFVKKLQLKERYERHRDIVEKSYIRSYLKSYYAFSSNFREMLNLDFEKNNNKFAHTSISKDLFDRIIMGNYTAEKDYWRRPLAKFMGDLSSEII